MGLQGDTKSSPSANSIGPSSKMWLKGDHTLPPLPASFLWTLSSPCLHFCSHLPTGLLFKALPPNCLFSVKQPEWILKYSHFFCSALSNGFPFHAEDPKAFFWPRKPSRIPSSDPPGTSSPHHPFLLHLALVTLASLLPLSSLCLGAFAQTVLSAQKALPLETFIGPCSHASFRSLLKYHNISKVFLNHLVSKNNPCSQPWKPNLPSTISPWPILCETSCHM